MISRKVALHLSGIGFEETPEEFKANPPGEEARTFYCTLTFVWVLKLNYFQIK
jgi:hypothetical protein